MDKIRWFSLIRITGLAFVLIYHFFKPLLPGGFLGVDIFFTFSGYLITAQAVDTFRQKGRFSLLSFYRRRFSRIYPSLLLMVLFTLPFTLLISPDYTVGIGRQAAAALGLVTNWFEIATGGSYEGQLFPHLFLHTWSLALEVHFYLVWGLICAGAAILLSRLHKADPARSAAVLRGALLAAAALLAAGSYLRMRQVYGAGPAGDPSAAYFGTGSRGLPFMVGAIAGALPGFGLKEKMPKPFSSRPAGIAAAAVLLCAGGGAVFLARTLDFTAGAVYRFGIPAASGLGALMILSARILHEAVPSRIREPGILRVPSDISYHVYLFHWPLYIVFSALMKQNAPAALVTLALAFLFAALVFYGAEPAIRALFSGSRQDKTGKTRPVYAALTVSVAAALFLSGRVYLRAPAVSSVEWEIGAGYLRQDADGIGALQRISAAVAKAPVTAQGLPGTVGNLKKNPLPPPASSGPPAKEVIAPVVPVAPDARILGGVTVVGDSVCLGARKKLLETIPGSTVDAVGSRQIWEGCDLLLQWQNQGVLREYVVVALGTNQNKNAFAKIDQIIAQLRPGCRLIFVTPYNGRILDEKTIWYKTGAYMRALPEKYPFVTVADWAAEITAQPALLGSDKIHIGGRKQAIQLYTNCIVKALGEAAGKPAKGGAG